MTFLTVQHVSHQYFSSDNYTKALEDISFEVSEGQFLSLIGPSGCGKTTLLSIIAGLIHPTEGTVLLEGNEIQKQKVQLGYMLQQDYLFPWKTIKENVLLGPHIQRKKDVSMEKQAEELLAEIGIGDTKNLYPNQLSGGMRQRASLARTLITDPKILLLDEPFSALDYQTKLKLENLVATILKTYEKTAILVTHDIEEAIAMSDTIIMLSASPGKIHKIFSVPEELQQMNPFEARQHAAFPSFFQNVWKEMDDLGQ